MSKEGKGRSSYLDLLIATLMEHEKNLASLLDKLERISEVLSEEESKTEKRVVKKEESEKEDDSDTLIYMKIRMDRSLDEVLRILESLKD